MHCVKLYLADRLTRKKTRTVANDFGMFLRFRKMARFAAADLFDWRHLTEGLARGFLAHGMNTADKGNDFSRLRTFYEWSVAAEMEVLTRLSFAGCRRSQPSAMRKAIMSGFVMRSEGRFLPMNYC